MPGPFPCNNPPSTCETSPNPATNFSSEAVDSTTYIALAWNNKLPALGTPFTSTPCEAIAESQVSQADADRIAANQAITCSNPCASPVFNTAQTASARCSDGNPYSFTVPAGLFSAENQVLADRKAFAAAVAGLNGHSICLGGVAPASVCRGEFYFGIISIVTTDTPVTTELVQGDLPDGLTFTFESTRVVIQGTPSSFGNSQFILRCTSAAGVVTSRQYLVTVTGIVTSSLDDGSVGNAYSEQLTTVLPEGMTASWAVTVGALPDGLSLDADTGIISGTPTTAETSDFTISVTVAGSTCSKDFSLRVTGTGGVGCLCDDGDSIDTIDGTPDGPLMDTRTASVRRMVLVDTDDSKVAFIDTSTNTVVNTIDLATGYGDGSRFKNVAFATSTQNFFFQDADFNAMTVTDINGNVVGSLAAPAGYNFSREPWAYSPDTDRLFTLQFNGDTGTAHILEFNPNTLALTRDVDTTTDGYSGLFCYPGNLVLFGFQLQNFDLPTLTNDKSSDFLNSRGRIDYDPVSNQLFGGDAFDNGIFVVNCTDFSTAVVLTPAHDNGPYEFVSYNPVMQVIICYNFSADIVVIDPSTNTIFCQTSGGGGSGMGVDYSSGNVYLFTEDSTHNPLHVFTSCPPDICTGLIVELAANRYGIDGYFDGMIPNPSDPSVKPAWDGTFPFFANGGPPNAGFTGWVYGGLAHGISVSGNKACNVTLLLDSCPDGVPNWQLSINDIDSNPIWQGTKIDGDTPEGVYNLTGGVDASPLTLTIVLVDTTATPAEDGISCVS
jgi:hypothetical protein